MTATAQSPHLGQRIRRWLARIVLLALAAGIVGIIVVAWMPKPIPVDTAKARVSTLTITVDEDGYSRMKDRYLISAPLSGTIDRIELDPGASIAEGAVLARILPLPTPLLDPKSKAQAQAALAGAEAGERRAQAAQAQAQAAFDFASDQIDTQKSLAQRGTITKQQLERAQLDLETKREQLASSTFGVRVARHEAQMARAALGRLGANPKAGDQMILTSPVQGNVLDVVRDAAGVIQAGAPVLEIGDPAGIEIVVDVLTTDAVQIQPGAKAQILRWGGPGQLEARVLRIEPKAFRKLSSLGVEERRVNVILDLESPREAWAALGDGYRVEASITTWQGTDLLTVPVSAIFKHEQRWHVFVVDGQNARLRPVELGKRNGFDAQIVSGLQADETIIIHPGERIADGSLIQPR